MPCLCSSPDLYICPQTLKQKLKLSLELPQQSAGGSLAICRGRMALFWGGRHLPCCLRGSGPALLTRFGKEGGETSYHSTPSRLTTLSKRFPPNPHQPLTLPWGSLDMAIGHGTPGLHTCPTPVFTVSSWHPLSSELRQIEACI